MISLLYQKQVDLDINRRCKKIKHIRLYLVIGRKETFDPFRTVLNIFMYGTILLPNFYPLNLQHSSVSIYFGSEWKTVWILTR